MIKITQRQHLNLLEAIRFWAHVPEKVVTKNLGRFRTDGPNKYQGDDEAADNELYFNDQNTCGIIACFGGWCALNDVYREQGLRFDAQGYIYLLEGDEDMQEDEQLFGVKGLFYARGFFDTDLIRDKDGKVIADGNGYPETIPGTDWEVVLRRLSWAILNMEVDNG